MMDRLHVETPPGLSTEDLECKICYCTYSLSDHRPKVLECRHRLCSKCLAKLLDLGESPPNQVVCPFCRYWTGLPGDSVASLPDDSDLVTGLSVLKTDQLSTPGENMLSPGRLTSLVGHSASAPSPSVCSNYVVITLLGSRDPVNTGNDSSSSSDPMASAAVWNCTPLLCWASARALVWFLGLLYFSSLPLGIYLLITKKTTVGALLLGLAPVSLLGIVLYGICQCMIQEFFDRVPP